MEAQGESDLERLRERAERERRRREADGVEEVEDPFFD
jgi:hypothetical protein